MKFETIGNNKKKVKITLRIVCIIAIIGITAFTLTRASYKQTQSVPLLKGNISYNKSDLEIVAIKLQQDDGTYNDATEIPSIGYILNTDITKSYCKVGTTTEKVDYRYESGSHYIKAAKKGSKCYLSFDKLNGIQASTFLKNKNEMVNENGYRYEGKSPNNYVTFNNEVWRIIGVFDVVNGITGETESLVKIIRNESIGSLPWNTNEINDWSKASLMRILNGDYYDKKNTYSSIGLNAIASNMIQSVVWNLGGGASSYLTASQLYAVERGTSVYSGRPTSWIGNIGLMYPSDYGYAAISTLCSRTTEIGNYSSSCYNNNWIYNGDYQWTITHCTSNPDEVMQFIDSLYDSENPGGFAQIRPVVYLNSNVSILDNGKDGSVSKPYDLILN